MNGRYRTSNDEVNKSLNNKTCISWLYSEPGDKPRDGLKPLKYNKQSKKRYNSTTNKEKNKQQPSKKIRVSPIVVPNEMKNKNKKGGKTKKKRKKKKKMVMKAGTRKSFKSL